MICSCLCVGVGVGVYLHVGIIEMYVSHAGLKIGCRESKDVEKGEKTSFQVIISNVSSCKRSAPPYDVIITADNASIRYHKDGTVSPNDTSLSIRDHDCMDATTFVFSVWSSKPIMNVIGRIVNALLNESYFQYGKCILQVHAYCRFIHL